jgi:hypothetical protein
MYHPKNKLEKFFSLFMERSLPTFQYFVWNPHMRAARESGWTVQEKLFHNFFRINNINYHAYAQAIHPFGYLERQRGDQFIRRVETIIPGMEAPAWAQNWRRAPDFDIESVLNPLLAKDEFSKENTPKPHYNSPNYQHLHIFNLRYNLGYPAQRLFYNEVVRGDFLKGYFTKTDLQDIDSWYAGNYNNLEVLRRSHLSPEQLKTRDEEAERWRKNIDEFFPEFRNIKKRPDISKFDEPYYERTVNNIRFSILTGKWINAIERNTFTNEEIQNIHHVFLGRGEGLLWEKNADGNFEGTALYTKLSKTLNFPDVFALNKFTAKIPEKQFLDQLDRNLGINFRTVDAYRNRHIKYINSINKNINNEQVARAVRKFVSEEVYNPLFRQKVVKSFKLSPSSDNDSAVAALLQANINTETLNNLDQLYQESKDQLAIFSTENQQAFLSHVRKVVSTFTFKQGDNRGEH